MSTKNNVVSQLENRVQATVGLIQDLKQDNRRLTKEYSQLQEKILEYEKRVSQLEELISIAEKEQKHLEKSVISALSNLDDVEELHSQQSIKETSVSSQTSSSKNSDVANDIFVDTPESDDKDDLEIF